MMFSTITLVSLFNLISLSLALPTSGSNLVARAGAPDPSHNCPTGKSWFTCHNNINPSFEGCCSVDPCDRPSCPDPPTGSNFILPPPRIIVPVGPMCQPGQHKLFPSSTTTIFPGAPDTSSSSPQFWVSQAYDASSSRQQVVAFSEIPSAAKKCQLNWTPHGQYFNVSGSGLTEVFKVPAPLPATITSKTITAAETIGNADFTNWPGAKDAEMQEHSFGNSQNCSEQMIFMVQIAGSREGDVRLQLDGQSGLFIEYEC